MTDNLSAGGLSNEAHPTPADLVAFVPYACAQLLATFRVSFTTVVQDEYVSKTDDKGKKLGKGKSGQLHQPSHTQRDSQDRDDETLAGGDSMFIDPNEIVITAVFDPVGRLVELVFERMRNVPRMLMKVIAMCMPYQTFLTRFTMRWVSLKGEIIYELTKFLPESRVTEVILEDSPVAEHNYYMLFEFAHLKQVSLVRCGITDDDCIYIASKLVHPQPAAKNLLMLSLVSNKISDVGACALGQALRSNRSLQYINLSGNRITDVGAINILRSLMEFNLTYSELLTKRERMMEHLRTKQDTYERCLKELLGALAGKSLDDGGRGSRRKNTPRSKKVSATSMAICNIAGMDSVVLKADAMANELVGILADPFSIDETESRDKQVYSLGNTALCYLNLAYNNLGYHTVVELFEVLAYQNKLERKSGPGLLRVVIEGNDMPIHCLEYAVIDDLLDKAMAQRMAKPARKVERGKSKTK